MEPRGQPTEIPINIDQNAWQVVLRDGVPTLVPRRYPEPPNPTALVRTNGNPGAQSNFLITQRSYEQGLALDYASQSTPLSDEQHQFLRRKLEALRGTIDNLTNHIDARRQVTMAYENIVQSVPSPTVNAMANSSLPQANFGQPNQQAQTVHPGQGSVFYNSGTQNVAGSVPRQGESSNATSFRNYPQGMTAALPHPNIQSVHTNTPVNSGGLPRTGAMASNVSSRSTHQRQTSAQGLADQRQQIFQQAQQTYIDMSQPLNTASSQQSQPGSSRAIRNASIPQQYFQNAFQRPVTNTSRVQAGVPYVNGSPIDYQNQWLRGGPANHPQTPARQQNALPQAHISPESNQNTNVHQTSKSNPASAAQTNATHPADPRSIVPPISPQHAQATSAPVTVVIPSAPGSAQPRQSHAPLNSHINSLAHPQTVPAQLMSVTQQMLSAAIQNTNSSAFRKPEPLHQPQPSAAPGISSAPRHSSTVSAPFPAPSAAMPSAPVKAPGMEEVSVKDEPVEDVSLAQAILQLYGKRKVMDSAGSPAPASKRRALGTNIAGERQAVDVKAPSVPSGDWPADTQIGSTEPMDESAVANEAYDPGGLDDFIFSETAPDITQANATSIVEEPTPVGDQLSGNEVPMHLTEFDDLHPDTTSQVQSTAFLVDSVMGHPPLDSVDDLPRVDVLSDEMNVPEASRSPSAARISSVSENSEVPARDLVQDGAQHSEAEVEGAIMVDVDNNEHQLTPVPERERDSPELPLFLPETKSPERGERGVTPLLRSPSIPLFQSMDKIGTGKGKKTDVSRSGSPPEPLFLPMPSSSSSDVEIVEESLQRNRGISAGKFNGPRRRFLGVIVPFVPGLSRTAESKSRNLRRRRRYSPTDSEIRLATEIFTTARPRSRRRPMAVSSSESDNELTELVSSTRPVIGDNGLVNDPYSTLNPTPCLWAHCDAVLDSLTKLVKHVEVIHTTPEILQSGQSDTIPHCRWDGCKRRTWAWRDDEGGSRKLLRHVIKHIGPEMSCMIDGCAYSTKDREEFRQHCDEAHKDDQDLRLKASTTPNIIPREPTQGLPNFAPASEALFLAVYGDSAATLRSRPPSPRTTSQAMSTMPLSPTKHRPQWRETEGRTTDEYSFLDPFYPPALYMDDLGQTAMELFELECYGAEEQSMRGRSMSEEP